MILNDFFHKAFSVTSVYLLNSPEKSESFPFDKYKNPGSKGRGFLKDWESQDLSSYPRSTSPCHVILGKVNLLIWVLSFYKCKTQGGHGMLRR